MNYDKSIASRFSASALTYDTYAEIQKISVMSLTELIKTVPKPERVIEIGCGTGLLTELLYTSIKPLEIYALDISNQMILSAQKRLADIKNVKWICNNINSVKHKDYFDMAVSSSTVHWIKPLENFFITLQNLLKAGGFCIFSTMVYGTLRELHESRREVVPGKPVKASIPEAAAFLLLLSQSGFEILSKHIKNYRVDFSSAESMLLHLHTTGVTGGDFSRSDTLLNKKELDKLISYYNTQYKNSNGGVYATYSVLYVKAQKMVLL